MFEKREQFLRLNIEDKILNSIEKASVQPYDDWRVWKRREYCLMIEFSAGRGYFAIPFHDADEARVHAANIERQLDRFHVRMSRGE